MKQLKDYTLEEVQTECRRHTISCGLCKFFDLCFPYNDTSDEMQPPCNWKLDAEPAKIETIVWHPYNERVELKPMTPYLVEVEEEYHGKPLRWVTDYTYMNKDDGFEGIFKVLAYAEQPSGYTALKGDDNSL